MTQVGTAGMASGGPINTTGTVTVSINAQTGAAPATNDELAIYDVSAAAHRKATVADILALQVIPTPIDDYARYNVLLEALVRRRVHGTQGGFGIVNGYVDAYLSDTIGAASTNETYDAAGDYYTNPGTPTTSYANAGGSGNRTASITVTYTGSWQSAPSTGLVNGTTNDNVALLTNGADNTGSEVRFDFGAGAANYFTEIKEYQQSATAENSTWKWQGSNDRTNWYDMTATETWDAGTKTRVVTGNYGPWRYVRRYCVSGNSTTNSIWWYEVEFKLGTAAGVAPDMTLQGNAVTAAATPTTAWFVALVDPVDAVTYNTDYVASITNNNATYDTLVLTNVGSYDGTYDILVGKVTLTGNSNSVNYRKATANSKELRDAGVAYMWG